MSAALHPARRLAELLPELGASALGALAVDGLCMDSREVRPGDAFIALAGARHDGLTFAPAALARGARVVLADADACTTPGEHIVAVPHLAARVSEVAGRFYEDPSHGLMLVGVTGTNGKTTCTQLIAGAFESLGTPCGVIGTLGWGFPGRLDAARHTTPDAVAVQRMLATLRDAGARATALEVSSHALEQGRVRALQFRSAVFTNLTHDHLDYHGTLENYGAAKQLLFAQPGLQHALINVDDAWGRHLLQTLPPAVHGVGYGLREEGAVLRATRVVNERGGLRAEVVSEWGEGSLFLPLFGRFNLYNALAVLGVLCVNGVALADALAVLEHAQPIAGRMQRISAPTAPLVIVDYAHSPDALEQVLRALREHTDGRLWCVFGCGGDRDHAKRPLMGRIAWENADEVLITSDNPRSEDPHAIIEDIATGIPQPDAARESDRAVAIRRAILQAAPGDCVLIAGKGHEAYQEAAGVRVPFSDAVVAREALAAREAGS